MKEPQVLVTERAKLNLGSDSLRSKSSNQSVIDQVIEMLTAYVLKSDYNVDKAILNQQINDILSRLDNIPSMNIDDFLSLDSENPVQNKIITAALNAKPDKDTTYIAGTNVSIDANNVISAVDTKYTAGNNVSIINNVISATDTTYTASDFDIKDLSDTTDLKSTWSGKQDQLTAGENITIENNVISASDGNGLKQVDLATYTDGVEGEIVQHVGSTTNDYTHGYVYQLSPGHVVRYEDITIPSGSRLFVYTNKFDQSVKRVYSYEEVTLSESVSYYYKTFARMYNLDQTFIDAINDSDDMFNPRTTFTNILPNDGKSDYTIIPNNIVYYLFSRYSTNPYHNIINVSDTRSIYHTINNSNIIGTFRYTKTTRSTNIKVTDLVLKMGIQMTYTDSYGQSSKLSNKTYFFALLSNLESRNWDVISFLDEIRHVDFTPKSGQSSWWFDVNDVDETEFSSVDYGFVMTDSLNNSYYVELGGGSTDSTNSVYHVFSEDGNEEYYVPKSSSTSLILNKLDEITLDKPKYIDGEVYFDYTRSYQILSEPLTIHRKITEYDEYGFPIDYGDQPEAHWQRIDVQPANQLTAGTNISIDNGVISATDTTYTASDFDIKDLTDSTDLKSTWDNKQDQLTAGTNITIENNVISATSESFNGLKQVDLDTYSDGVEGEIVQHTGSTTNDYIHGYIYKCDIIQSNYRFKLNNDISIDADISQFHRKEGTKLYPNGYYYSTGDVINSIYYYEPIESYSSKLDGTNVKKSISVSTDMIMINPTSDRYVSNTVDYVGHLFSVIGYTTPNLTKLEVSPNYYDGSSPVFELTNNYDENLVCAVYGTRRSQVNLNVFMNDNGLKLAVLETGNSYGNYREFILLLDSNNNPISYLSNVRSNNQCITQLSESHQFIRWQRINVQPAIQNDDLWTSVTD